MALATTLAQIDRWLALDTPLGPDELVATGFTGSEGISKLFQFRVNAVSSKSAIEAKSILGQAVTLSVAKPGGSRRYINGIVTAFSGGGMNRSGFRLYTLTVSPKFWVLGRRSDYKVFQNKTSVEIVEDVLRANDVEFQKSLQKTYLQREYCVQFGETDLAFVERLLAESGILYYFTHRDGGHRLVLTDNESGYTAASQADVFYRQDQQEATDSIYKLDVGATLTDAEWMFEEYDFETPSQKLQGKKTTSQQPASAKGWQQYHYRAAGKNEEKVDFLASAAIAAVDGGFESATGQSTCSTFTPGHTFTLKEHMVSALSDKEFVLTDVEHEALDRTHFAMFAGADGKPFYRNTFSCSPSERVVAPPLPREKPLAMGPQTAVVVGPSGEDIHTDKYGRIRLQFHWDRLGNNDASSSCYVRVAQSMAGSNWGAMFIPRIGMEVIVQFVDGDPDKPLVTGAVYNADNLPPWTLPDNMTKSGLLTRSSKQGAVANANELSFEDKKGSELVLFHAEKDFTREVENDDSLDVGHDQKRTIKNNRTSTITEGNDAFTIEKGNRTETIKVGNETFEVTQGNRTMTIGGNEELTVKTGNRKVDIKTGNDTLTITQGNRSTTLSTGNDSLTLNAGNHTTKASTGTITLEATQGITLKCGGNTIEITPQGISINGMQVSIQGTAKGEIKAPILNVSGDGMLTLKGGMVQIN